MKKILLLLVATCSALVMLAQSEFQVSNIRKISATQGGFTGKLDAGDLFSRGICIGDVDGDGNEDMAVSAESDDDGTLDAGAVWILFLNADRSVKSQQKISATQGDFNATLKSDAFGMALAPLGDFDNDGTPDIAVSAYYDSDGGGNCGAVYIILLKPDGKVKSYQKISGNKGGITGLNSGLLFGSGLCNIGDLNNDGVVDIAVGAPRFGKVNSTEGGVWILFLNADGTVKSQQIIGNTLGNFNFSLRGDDMFGTTVSNIGDINGDGMIDIAVHARGDDDGAIDAGATYILFLNSDGKVKGSNKISAKEGSFKGIINAGDFFGYSSVGIGDIDGDGINDIATSVLNSDIWGANKGAIYFVLMNNDGSVKGHQGITELAPFLKNEDRAGIMLSIFQTKNSRGYKELIVGAFNDDDGASNAGALYIMDLGADSTFSATNIKKISATQGGFTGQLNAEDLFCRAVAIGDIDGDGIEDLAVGAHGDDDGYSESGAVWILFMNENRTVRAHQKISSLHGGFLGNIKGNRFGGSIAAIGDMNNDGVPDIAVSAYYDSDGAVFILFLNQDGTVKSYQKISATQGGLVGLTQNRFFGSGLCSLGDLDGDGVTDLAVGAPNYDYDGGLYRGSVWILFLNSNGTVKSQQIISQTQGNFKYTLVDNSRFGASLANIGDVNGDGIPDISASARGDNDGGSEAGANFILFLNKNGTVKESQKISALHGNFKGEVKSEDWFGFHSAGLGDIDGDGIPDMALSAPKSDLFGNEFGVVYILNLNRDGTIKKHEPITLVNQHLDNNDWFGVSLSTFSGLNKNGKKELIVGVHYDDDGASNAGALYIMDLGAAPTKPIANAGANQTICGNETATINGSNSTNPTGSALAYAWSSPNYTISTPNAANFTFTPQASSTTATYAFVLTVTSGDVVSDPDTVFVTVNPVPSRPTLSSSNDKIQSNVTASTYNWFLNNEPISNANSNPLTTKAPGNYHLIVSNEFGCASSKSNTITVQDISGLSVSRTELLMKATAGSFGSVKITTNLTWTATCDQDWLTMNANSATGTSTLIFTAAANDAETNRIAIVTIGAEGVDSVTITITQLAKPFLQASQNSVSLENTVGSLATIDVLSNANWKATTSNDWLTVSPTGYNGNATLSISALANNQLQNRNGIVTLTATGADTVRIEVIQAPGTPFLSVSETELTFEADSTIAGIQIQSNTTWTATTTANWLTFSKNEGSETDSLEFALEYNTASTDREAIVNLQANGVESVTVRIIQKARAILSASTDSISFEHVAGQLLSFKISSNIDWNLSADQNWIVCNKKTGNGNSEISISNLANTTTKERTGTITITGLNVQPVTITVVQQAMPYSKVDLQTVYIDKEKNSLRGVEIETNQLWTASTTSEWLTVNTLNGVGSGIISLQTTEANPNPQQRSAIVTITMADATTINVTVIQRPTHILSISASHLTVKAAKGSKAIVPVICSTDWTAVSNQSWLSVSALSGTGDNTFEFTAAENTSFESRFATVIISATEVYSDTVFIEQLGAIRMLSANKNEIQLDSTANSTGQIEIVSNVTWNASTTEAWLSVSPTSKLGNQTITITAQGNRASVQRSAIITIAGQGTDPITITVTQAAGKGTGVDDLDQSTISMYPNPTRNGFKVSGVQGNSVLSISDVNGRRMLSQVVSDNEFVNTSNLRNGMYVVQITSNGIVYNQKLIIR